MLHISDGPSALHASRANPDSKNARKKPLVMGIALALSVSMSTAHAATIVLNQPEDQLNSSQCTLRNAIISANTDTSVGNCTAGSGTDIIDMSAIAGQTVSLIGDSIQITSALTINGENVTVSGGNAQRVFEVTNGANATINNMVISGGRIGSPGAGINVNTNATLTLNRSTISGNTATGAAGLGGGIFAQTNGTINVNQSTISGNSAFNGGGVGTYNYGTVNLSNSTVSGNTATNYGGGIHAWQSEVHLLRSTVANNTVAAGGNYSYGGGVFLSVRNYAGQVTLTDSIIADSVGGVAGSEDCDSNTSPGYGQVFKYGVNLVEKGTGCELVASPGVLLTTDPGLGTLTNNGGQTLTHSIPSGSAARDPSPNSCPGIEVDQRNLARFDGSCDLGAFEYGGLAFQSGPDFEVTASDDSNDKLCEIAPGHCSLREAINSSNANPDTSTITFANSLLSPSPATITLSGTQLPAMTTMVSIQGTGVTVDGDGNSRIFDIKNAIRISEITLNNGSAVQGGAIRIQSGGELSLSNSTLAANTAIQGGAIFVETDGTTNLTDSTLTGNTAQKGGAIVLDSQDAPYFLPPSIASLEQSTLSGNQANTGGGIYAGKASSLTLKGSTLSGNSAEGIFLEEGYRKKVFLDYHIFPTKLQLVNSVIAGSSGADCDDTSDYIEVSVLGGNLVEDGLCPSSLTGDPMLGPLADNGGLTFTHLPLIGSPLIDAGANAQITQVLDQRGEPRIASGTVDIGSVEFHLPPQPPQTGPNFVVSSSADDNDGICETAPGHCSLREAINGSNANDDHSTITFVPGVTTVTLQSQLPTLATTITIQGDDTLIQGDDVISTRLLELSSSTVTLNNLTLADGNADGPTPGYNWGGCILSSNSDLTLNNSHVRDCQGYGGGGLNHLGGRLTILDSTITGNSVADSGGGLYFDGQDLTVSRSTIAENSANYGGGLQIGGASQAHIEQSTISGNYANYGGGILTSGVVESGLVLQLVNATLSGNYAQYFAGAISAGSGSITFLNTTVAGNTAGVYVGGIEMRDNPNLVISNSIFSNGERDCLSNVTLAPTRGVNIMQNNPSCNFSGSQPLQVDPVLGPLADNGGPTLTHALLAGSPAINAGDNSEVPVELTTDQRGSGFLRIQSSAVDIGSFEIQSAFQAIFRDGFESPPK